MCYIIFAPLLLTAGTLMICSEFAFWVLYAANRPNNMNILFFILFYFFILTWFNGVRDRHSSSSTAIISRIVCILYVSHSLWDRSFCVLGQCNRLFCVWCILFFVFLSSFLSFCCIFILFILALPLIQHNCIYKYINSVELFYVLFCGV